ncbi:ABC transporter substrate-binding protein [Acetobacter sp. DsW_059]|uniref:ABC transporter substrate-binding protein n=1 Tax=Acetobacter sp. DsW_059 TaxID=1670661 RepID=UPI000A368AD9|nr:ABC transporter substrate-binding protein [Acetobacter sp. DsW_059]
MRWLIPLIGIVYCGVLAGHGQAASRIASLNLCTDQLALMLADKEEIVALSPLVRDCSASVLCHEGLPHVIFAADAENILSVHPDIVLAGQYTARTAVMAAREVGAHIVILPPARRLSDIPGQIRRVAQAVGHPERGEALIETLLAWRPDLLILDRSGQGHSLAQAMLDNPVLTEFFPGVHHVNIPASLWLCGLPQTLEAVAVLRRARAALAENKTEAP